MPYLERRVFEFLNDVLSAGSVSVHPSHEECAKALAAKQVDIVGVDEAGCPSLGITELGKAALDADGRGLPVAMRELLFAAVPQVEPALFDLEVGGERARAREFLSFRHRWGPHIRYADFSRPSLQAWFEDERTGRSLRFLLVFPAGTGRKAMAEDSLGRLATDRVLERATPDIRERGIVEPDDYTRIVDRRHDNVAPDGLAAISEEANYVHTRDWRRTWNQFLSDLGGSGGASFLEALDSPDLDPRRAYCEDGPEEVCVRVDGRWRDRGTCRDLNVLLLAPSHDRQMGRASEALADAIVENWGRLRALRREMIAAPAGAEGEAATEERASAPKP